MTTTVGRDDTALDADGNGHFTFLFTDIEGSTRLWEEQPEAMRVALARHDALLRSAITAHDGIVFKTMGDAFCAAFPSVTNALRAALDLQIALASETRWPDGVRLAVRVAVHHGAAESRDGDFFGASLNRVARLLAAGHGGQTLISAATHAQIRDGVGHLPPRCELAALGEHRLRDLSQSETIYQLTHPDLPATFPPLRALSTATVAPNNLSRQRTSFIGRDREMVEIRQRLADARLLTVVGAGGIGKTRLCVEIAARALEAGDTWTDGVWLVELAALTDPNLVPQTIARALGLRDESGRDVREALTDFLRTHPRTLLLLDNCEHLIHACAEAVDALLRACPVLTILASSREPLAVPGETLFRVAGLSLPEPGDLDRQTPRGVGQFGAVRLFLERASAVQPSFAVTESNAPVLARICTRIDGIPLALELAAARVRSMPIEEINVRLSDAFRLLTGGSRTALPRQRTLRALIDWSYALLSEPEKRLFARLSVFAGGWTLESAEAVCTGADGDAIDPYDALDLLTALADKSLVVAEPTEAGATRYRLLETMRQYAAERLREAENGDAVWRYRVRHRDHFAEMAEKARGAQLRPDAAALWLARLTDENDNVRAALETCLHDPDGGTIGMRMVWMLLIFWFTRGLNNEGRAWAEAMLAHPGAQEPTPVRGWALCAAGVIARRQGDLDAARFWFDQAHAVAGRNSADDPHLYERTVANIGNLAMEASDFDRARTFLEKALELGRALPQPSPHAIASNLCNLGVVVRRQGDLALARALQEEARALFEQNGNLGDLGVALHGLAEIARCQGDLPGARGYLTRCIDVAGPLQYHSLIIVALESWARLLAASDETVRAVTLLASAQAMRERIGEPVQASYRPEYDAELAVWRDRIGDADFDAAFAHGRNLSEEQAIEFSRSA